MINRLVFRTNSAFYDNGKVQQTWCEIKCVNNKYYTIINAGTWESVGDGGVGGGGSEIRIDFFDVIMKFDKYESWGWKKNETIEDLSVKQITLHRE